MHEGKVFSVLAFNCGLRKLRDEILKFLPGGVRATLPPFAYDALCAAAQSQFYEQCFVQQAFE